jgi:hypothetical protein
MKREHRAAIGLYKVNCSTVAVVVEIALTRYTDDRRLEIDNSAAERALRAVALGRKNYLFVGSDCGGERAAATYSLILIGKPERPRPGTLAPHCPGPDRRPSCQPHRPTPAMEPRCIS